MSDARRGGDKDFLLIDPKWRVQASQKCRRPRGGKVGGRNIVDYGDEFIAAETAQGIAFSQALGLACSDGGDHIIAFNHAQAFIDHAKAVDVDSKLCNRNPYT